MKYAVGIFVDKFINKLLYGRKILNYWSSAQTGLVFFLVLFWPVNVEFFWNLTQTWLFKCGNLLNDSKAFRLKNTQRRDKKERILSILLFYREELQKAVRLPNIFFSHAPLCILF